jgi:hypothetical protein
MLGLNIAGVRSVVSQPTHPCCFVRPLRGFSAYAAPVSRPVQRIGSIKSNAILGGLHHHYVRAKVFGTHTSESAAIRAYRNDCTTRTTTYSAETGQGNMAGNEPLWLLAHERRSVFGRNRGYVRGPLSR